MFYGNDKLPDSDALVRAIDSAANGIAGAYATPDLIKDASSKADELGKIMKTQMSRIASGALVDQTPELLALRTRLELVRDSATLAGLVVR